MPNVTAHPACSAIAMAWKKVAQKQTNKQACHAWQPQEGLNMLLYKLWLDGFAWTQEETAK